MKKFQLLQPKGACDNQMNSTTMLIRKFTSPLILENASPHRVSKSTIFANLWKADAETDTKRQNRQVDFHSISNVKISNLSSLIILKVIIC